MAWFHEARRQLRTPRGAAGCCNGLLADWQCGAGVADDANRVGALFKRCVDGSQRSGDRTGKITGRLMVRERVDIQPLDVNKRWNVLRKRGIPTRWRICAVPNAADSKGWSEVGDREKRAYGRTPLGVIHTRHELMVEDVAAEALAIFVLLTSHNVVRLTCICAAPRPQGGRTRSFEKCANSQRWLPITAVLCDLITAAKAHSWERAG